MPAETTDKAMLASLNRLVRATEQAGDVAALAEARARRAAHPNPLVRYGAKVWSQADEDGITLEILRRMGIATGTFAELGVGNGLENSTLALLALGWRGVWLGGADLAFDPTGSERLAFRQGWITPDTAPALVRETLDRLDLTGWPDVLSVDLDGNDLHVAQALLAAGARPRLFLIEYNARFVPPMRFCIDADPGHAWAKDDYFGASLQSLADMFGGFGYACICCNAGSGANAFFVQSGDLGLFPEVPGDLALIHAEPNYRIPRGHGHPPSPRTIRKLIGLAP